MLTNRAESVYFSHSHAERFVAPCSETSSDACHLSLFALDSLVFAKFTYIRNNWLDEQQ